MPDFIHDLPADRLALYCILLTVGATWFGVLFLKPILRLLVGREANVNETIGIATSVFGLFYGLLVGLLAVAAYQNGEEVEKAAFREAARISTLYANLESYPEPTRSLVREMLRDYVLFTIHKDWPAHRAGLSRSAGPIGRTPCASASPPSSRRTTASASCTPRSCARSRSSPSRGRSGWRAC